ncbi:MAG TPA: ethanolamine ammonia-lyase subunit EutC [Pirellulales bacterium]|jgi:ethanolamine ammonia-lyase small subunit|nr:ethanolamine ammonia-lyase subunit EutC [Pirellulales bacterium]
MPSSPDPTRPGVPSFAEVEALAALRARTPARLVVGRAGLAYRTSTQLDLREDHAAALDAVHAELDLNRDLGSALIASAGLFEVATLATSKHDYLRQPELGRQLSPAARRELTEHCPRGIDLQVVIGDGLSAAAIAAQVPTLLPLLAEGAGARGWTFGRPFVVRHCRVGILNEIGDLLDPEMVVLLIGERPGLACAVSLSAYLAYRPRAGDTDARRNLISNIHARGVISRAAATRILALADHMRQAKTSGVEIKECLPAEGQHLGLGPATIPNRSSP